MAKVTKGSGNVFRDLGLPDAEKLDKKARKMAKKQKLPSGKFITRVPPKLHKALAGEAENEGVSLNLFVACALARAQGQREAFEKSVESFLKLGAEIETLQGKNAELERVFELQQTRMGKATKMWRKAHPGKKNVLPDLGDLLEWLMEGKK